MHKFSKNGKGFICTHSTAKNGTIFQQFSRNFHGSVVTTSKNDIDHVVTEFGIAQLSRKKYFRSCKRADQYCTSKNSVKSLPSKQKSTT
ncbi:hypothetical protein KHA80_05370 [Anaerobacillus sp. HL2]|nr:hypothetical protein KHA80_05370 [Anaerobacillus sp. HL2]